MCFKLVYPTHVLIYEYNLNQKSNFEHISFFVNAVKQLK